MKKRRATHEFFHYCGLTMANVLRLFRPHVLFLTSLGITRRTNSAKFFQTRACSHFTTHCSHVALLVTRNCRCISFEPRYIPFQDLRARPLGSTRPLRLYLG